MLLAQEPRHQCEQQKRDQGGRVGHETGGERERGQDVLRLPEDLGEQRGPAGHLPPRPVQPVLFGTAFELFEVERRRMVHETDACQVTVALRQEAVGQPARPCERRGADGERELEPEQPAEPVEPARSQPGPQVGPGRDGARLRHNGVDDQFADDQPEQRRKGAREPQGQTGHEEERTGGPDKTRQRHEVTERANALRQCPA